MSAHVKQDPFTELTQAETLRCADLTELLGHISTRWDDERRMLARQLHDNLGSSLTTLTMHLSLLAQKMPQDPALLERTAQMKQLLLNVIAANRQMQSTLWNDKLEFLGVTAAFRDLAAQFAEQHQMTVRCSLPENELDCPRSHAVALLRTLEEGLSNIAAHAQASEVNIILDDNDEAVMLTLHDNGIGCAHGYEHGSATQPNKHGLRALRERVRHLGGSMTLTPKHGHGSTLTVTLPKVLSGKV